jgi:hypothetical protein
VLTQLCERVAEHLREEPQCVEVSLGLQELDDGASAKLRLEVVGPRGGAKLPPPAGVQL